MPDSEFEKSQSFPRGNRESQLDQPAGETFYPPFSGKLSVDEELNLSKKNFKESIDDFFKDKGITRLSQLTATPSFPTPYVLAQFASKAYKDYKTGKTKAQCEKQLKLPDGWKLLTTASNSRWNNGYFGAAYWHPEHQQVVIAHRGTLPTNLGALRADVKGVLLNRYVSQMDSASTFAHTVVEVLQEVNRKYRVSFQLFFTGHSLGGWLAQVTTFTTEYLKAQSKFFLRSVDDNDCFHPHTVVFDSPGCKDMLLQMTDKLDVRLDGRSIDIEHLDITSYLSAPNRINTCNAHIGTVYRIFPDMSNMGRLEKHTPLYNVAIHSMQKILEVFDTATGQVHKDEAGRLKVHVVVDWPISAGLLGGKEYNNFFKSAKHLNDYHLEVTDVTFQIEGYHPMRYQTKTYDERVSSLSVFCQKERQFLDSYLWVRQLPEFFEPQELFSVMEDNHAKQQAEIILKGFEIVKDKIYCTDASSLQALIPYVKRLLQLFPQIIEKTKLALSSDEVRNRFYQFEIRHYIERINQSPLEFKSEISGIREFIESGQQKVLHLEMIKGDEWTGLIKVYQLLQKIGCLIEGQYTILKLKRLLKVNQMMDLSKLMLSSVTPYLLLMACEDNELLDEETEEVIRTLFDTIKEKQNLKIIFITRSEGSTVDFLHYMGRRISGKGFVRRDEEIIWSDLTTSSQEKLLEKSVKFQGAKISLNELMSAESPAAKFLPLDVLLEENELTIADPVPISNGYNEGYYIGRTLRHQIAIQQGIFNDKDVKEERVFLASAEKEFKQLCQKNPNSNVHWLEKEKSGKLVWQQSQGSLDILRKYIDTESSPTYTADDSDKLLEQAQNQRVILISDTAGMGKSTLLTHLSKQIKQKFPDKWVVRIDLNDHTDDLNALKQLSKERAEELISKKVMKLKPGLEMELFKQCSEQKQKLRIVIMMDGLDEISPFYKDIVIDLLQALRQTAVEQLWVTTRPHLREQLEDKLQQLSYTLEPFSEENQVDFLTKFWNLKKWFTEGNSMVELESKRKLQVFAKELIKKLGNSISDEDRQFTGIPLQTRMLAEAFDTEVKIFYQSAESMPELQFQLDLLGLYGRFIDRKYDIYQEEKCQVPVNNVIAKEQRERDVKSMREDHQLLAFKVLFTEEQVTKIQNNRECKFSAEQLTRIGIVQVSHDGKPHFTHRVFAEYYVADCLVSRLTEGNNTSQQVQTFILKDVFQKEDYRVVRVFIDGLLSRSKPSEQVLKKYGNQIHGLWKDSQLDDDDDDDDENEYDDYDDDDGDNDYDDDDDDDDYGLYDSWGGSLLLLQRAVREGNANIIGFLLDSAQAAEDTDTVHKLLLTQDEERRTAWHQAVFSHNIQVSEKIWECVKRNQRAHELRRKLLLAKDRKKMNAWHLAVKKGKVDVLLKQWELAKENLTTEEVNKLLLATDNEGRTVFHLAAAFSELEVFQGLLKWAKENLTTEEVKKLLLATDSKRRTVFHVAAAFSEPEVFQGIMNWVKESLSTGEINKLLLATDNEGRTVFHVAAEFSELEVFQGVLNWAKENLKAEEVKKLLLATDSKKRTVFHVANEFCELELFQGILNLAKENLTSKEANKLLLATDNEGRTVFHLAAEFYKLEVFEGILNWAKKNLTTEEVKNLLLATDHKRRTVFHVARTFYKLEVFQGILNLAKENLTTEEVNKLLLDTDIEGRTVFHVATEFSELDVLQGILNWAKGNLKTEEVYKFLLATDNEGRTVFHLAAEFYKLEIFQGILNWAKNNLRTEEVKKLLLATDSKRRTVFHVATAFSELEVFQGILNWAKENLTTEEVKKLLLATDSKRRTVFYRARRFYKLEVFQGILNWAKENLTTEELKKILLATDSKRRTVFHIARKFHKLEVFQEILNLAKENLTTEEANKLLLATDNEGRTVFHLATEFYKPEVFQGILDWAKENLTTER